MENRAMAIQRTRTILFLRVALCVASLSILDTALMAMMDELTFSSESFQGSRTFSSSVRYKPAKDRFFEALTQNNFYKACMMLDTQPDLVNAQDVHGNTLLHMLITDYQKGYKTKDDVQEIFKRTLEKGANLYLVNNDGDTIFSHIDSAMSTPNLADFIHRGLKEIKDFLDTIHEARYLSSFSVSSKTSESCFSTSIHTFQYSSTTQVVDDTEGDHVDALVSVSYEQSDEQRSDEELQETTSSFDSHEEPHDEAKILPVKSVGSDNRRATTKNNSQISSSESAPSAVISDATFTTLCILGTLGAAAVGYCLLLRCC